MLGHCARCGRPLEEGRSVPPLCLECYVETTKLLCVPDRLDFDYCKYCGSMRLGHRWVEGGDLDEASGRYLRLYLEQRVTPCVDTVKGYRLASLTPLTEPSWRTIYSVVYEVELRGVDEPVRQEYRVEVRARPTICPMCKDARGGDYNVLLQLRGAEPSELARALEGLFNRSSQVVGSLVDIVELRNGVDMLLLDRGSASKILRELRKKYRLSVRVTGEDVGTTSTGRLRRRLVISARIKGRR